MFLVRAPIIWTRAHVNDLTFTWLPFQRLHLQGRSHHRSEDFHTKILRSSIQSLTDGEVWDGSLHWVCLSSNRSASETVLTPPRTGETLKERSANLLALNVALPLSA